MATVEQILNTDFPNPTFVWQPGQLSPLPEEVTYDREGKAQNLNENFQFEEVKSGEARIYGPGQKAATSQGATQYATNPTTFDPNNSAWVLASETSFTKGVETIKGFSVDKIEDANTSTSSRGIAESNFSGSGSGTLYGAQCIVAYGGREWIFLSPRMTDGAGDTRYPKGYFNILTGEIGTTDTQSDVTVREHNIQDVGGGYYRCQFSINAPSSLTDWLSVQLRMTTSDGGISYVGNPPKGVKIMYIGAYEQEMIGPPIFNSAYTRPTEVARVDTQSFHNEEQFTVIYTFTPSATIVTDNFSAFLIDTVSGQKIWSDNDYNFPMFIRFYDGNTTYQKGADTGTLKSFQTNKIAISVDQDGVTYGANGNCVNVNANTPILNTAPDFNLGQGNTQERIEEFRYYPTSFDVDELEILTAT